MHLNLIIVLTCDLLHLQVRNKSVLYTVLYDRHISKFVSLKSMFYAPTSCERVCSNSTAKHVRQIQAFTGFIVALFAATDITTRGCLI